MPRCPSLLTAIKYVLLIFEEKNKKGLKKCYHKAKYCVHIYGSTKLKSDLAV